MDRALCSRQHIFSGIVIQGNEVGNNFAERIEKVLSIVYGRLEIPPSYFVTTTDHVNFQIHLLFEEEMPFKTAHIGEFLNELASEERIEQPTPLMMERNVLNEPLWLVNAIGSCFEDLEDIPSFPLSFSSPQIEDQINSRSFHSPSLTDSDALYSIWYIFASLDLFDALQIDQEKFKLFLLVLKANYKPNPYHNFHHAVDVLQFVYLLLRSAPSMCELLSPLELFSLLLAAIGHDVGHTSYNNRFHCASESLLSILFNDQSVLENYHSLIIFAIIRHPKYNFCSSWTEDRWFQFRKQVISCVLSTDMAAHFKYLKQFTDAGFVRANLWIKSQGISSPS